DQGTILPVGVDVGGGVKTVGTPRLMSQGTLSPTGNDLDVAVRGEGFFKIQVPDGTYAYTRDGSFMMDAQGRVATAQGNPVQPTITIPQNSSQITINTQGQLTVTLPGSTTPTLVGQIGLTRFINKAGLNPIGDNLFTDTPASGTPQDGIANTDGFGDMQQSNLEQANVEVVTEISDLIAAQRAYVTGTGDLGRIGDIIDTAGTAAQIAIYRAPDLGTTGSLPVAQVLNALRSHRVIGVDTRDLKEISVTRLARTLEGKDIEA